MNYQQLARALKQEAGVSGDPSTMSAATASGEYARLFNWVNLAARDIFLTREDWRFRRGTATLASTSNASNTATDFGLTDFASWKRQNVTYRPSAYRVSDGAGMERALAWMDYDTYRMTYIGGVQATSAAQVWSVSPDEAFLLGPVPDSAHFIRADYIKAYTDMTLDADTPSIPARFHWMIVWRALMEYGGFEAGSEAYQRAEKNYNQSWTQLVQSQLDQPTFAARSLA